MLPLRYQAPHGQRVASSASSSSSLGSGAQCLSDPPRQRPSSALCPSLESAPPTATAAAAEGPAPQSPTPQSPAPQDAQ